MGFSLWWLLCCGARALGARASVFKLTKTLNYAIEADFLLWIAWKANLFAFKNLGFGAVTAWAWGWGPASWPQLPASNDHLSTSHRTFAGSRREEPNLGLEVMYSLSPSLESGKLVHGAHPSESKQVRAKRGRRGNHSLVRWCVTCPRSCGWLATAGTQIPSCPLSASLCTHFILRGTGGRVGHCSKSLPMGALGIVLTRLKLIYCTCSQPRLPLL